MPKVLVIIVSIALIISGFGMMHGGNSTFGTVGSSSIGLGSIMLLFFILRKALNNKNLHNE